MAEASGGLISKLARVRRFVALGLLATTSPFLLNCYGRFPLTRVIYKANGTMPSDILKTVVFWVFVIVPVYGVAMIVDALALNLIEFWTGAAVPIGATTDENGNEVVLTPSEDGKEALLTVSKDGAEVGRVRFVRVSDTVCEVRDASGELLGKAVRTARGDIELSDARGTVLGTLDAERIAALQGI